MGQARPGRRLISGSNVRHRRPSGIFIQIFGERRGDLDRPEWPSASTVEHPEDAVFRRQKKLRGATFRRGHPDRSGGVDRFQAVSVRSKIETIDDRKRPLGIAPEEAICSGGKGGDPNRRPVGKRDAVDALPFFRAAGSDDHYIVFAAPKRPAGVRIVGRAAERRTAGEAGELGAGRLVDRPNKPLPQKPAYNASSVSTKWM